MKNLILNSDTYTCPHCEGEGVVSNYYKHGDFAYMSMCPICLGKGQLTDQQLADYIGD